MNREDFSFVFVRNVVNLELFNDEKIVLDILRDNPNSTAVKIAELINRNSRTIQRITNQLKNKKMIERIGGTRGYRKVIK